MISDGFFTIHVLGSPIACDASLSFRVLFGCDDALRLVRPLYTGHWWKKVLDLFRSIVHTQWLLMPEATSCRDVLFCGCYNSV